MSERIRSAEESQRIAAAVLARGEAAVRHHAMVDPDEVRVLTESDVALLKHAMSVCVDKVDYSEFYVDDED